MNTLTRKQREMIAREAYFLEIASKLVAEEGIQAITMERLAELTEYSKGTLYKHFTCREDVICGICISGTTHLLELFNTALEFKGHSRERMVAISVAYSIYAKEFPHEFAMLSTSKGEDIRGKSSEQRIKRLELLDEEIDKLTVSVIEEAIKEGNLIMTNGLTPEQVCFGGWALNFGIYTIMGNNEVCHHFDLPPVEDSIRLQTNVLFDGYGWKPLSTEWDYRSTEERVIAFMVERLKTTP